MIVLGVERSVLVIKLRQVIESDPALSVFDSFEFFTDLLLRVAGAFHDFPKSQEFRKLDRAILVHIDLVKELGSRDLGET